ncbi:MAG: electron transport complex subunit RsxC [Endomicrobiia bacterium]
MNLNFVKFELKPEQELKSLLEEKNEIIILACSKCFIQYTSQEVSQSCNPIFKIFKKLNKNIKKCVELNFLCNTYINQEKILKIVNKYDKDEICVFSCGLGVQNVAKLVEKEIIAISDSIQKRYNSTAEIIHHGICINNDTFCATCGECFLNYTSGICSIVECPKSLLNGPCGGEKNGKCEVDKEKDCVWIKIYNLLKEKNYNNKVLIRNYNNLSFEEKKKLIEKNLSIRVEDFYGGVYPQENKNITQNISTEKFFVSQIVKIFLSQHIGKPAIPLVKIGDYVFLGQKIAESCGLISSNIHSSVSGKVIDIKEVFHPVVKKNLPAIIIENDYKELKDKTIIPQINWQNLTKQEILNIIFEKGIVGLGGAMFPTYVKLSSNKKIDTLIINASECEPYVNVDNRTIIENTKEIIEAINIIKFLLDIKNIVVAIEDNKTESIERLKFFLPKEIKVEVLKTKYPQGAEKILIKKLLGIKIPQDKIPLEYGVLVHNVSTVYSIYKAVVEGMPLIERIVTVAGDEEVKKNYGNYIIRIGTPIDFIVKNSFNEKFNLEQFLLKFSGYMMGVELKTLDTAIVKGCNSILALRKKNNFSVYNKCIKCGRCVDVCPMELQPLDFVFSYQENKVWDLERLKIKDCIECGCCEYICPSKIYIVDIIKKLKISC